MTLAELTSVVSALCAVISLPISIFAIFVSRKNREEIKKISGPRFNDCVSIGSSHGGVGFQINQK